MKKLITSFLILCTSLTLKAATHLPFFYIGPMSATTVTVNINAQGAVMPTAFGDTPTLFALTGASMAAGKKLVIDRRGGFSFLPNQADNTGTGILAAFVTSTGSIIPPDAESSVIVRSDGTFVAELGGVIVTIPNGATGIILGPFDTHPFDNEDANGDFRALISSPVLEEMLITQNNIENPDYNNDGKVDVRLLDAFSVSYDLVSSLNTDSAGFKMTDLDTSSTHFVDATSPDASGTITFNVDFEKLKQKGRSINFLKDVQFSFEYAAKKVKTDTVNIINPVLKIFQAENAGEDPVELTEDNPESLYLIKPEEMAKFVVETGVPNMPVTSSGLIIAFADNSGGGGNPLPNPKLGTTITIPPTQNTTDSEGKLYFETNFDYDLFGNHEAKVVVFIEEPTRRTTTQFFEKDFLFRVLNVEHKIYQVIENPNLEDLESLRTDKVIDLVAGKNADIVVKLVGPNGAEQDVSLSTLRIGDKVYEPKSAKTDENGEVVFEIDPVPEILNQELDLKIELKDQNGKAVGSARSKVKIWKTNPINIEFLPINGCDGKPNDFTTQSCFPALKDTDVTDLEKYSMEHIKAVYPVADKELRSNIRSPLPIGIPKRNSYSLSGSTELIKSKKIFQDMYVMSLSKLPSSTYLAMVLNPAYFLSYRDVPIIAGLAHASYAIKEGLEGGSDKVLMVRNDYYTTVAHELGHLFGVEHNSSNNNKCQGSPVDGYSSYKIDLGYDRKPQRVKCKLMNAFDEMPLINNRKWISKEEYLKLFKKNLATTTKEKTIVQSVFKITGLVSENDELEVLGSRFIEGFETSFEDGKFVVDILDAEESLLKQVYVEEMFMGEIEEKVFQVNLAIPSDALFIKIYKNSSPRKLIGSVVVPSEILKDNIRYIFSPFIKGNPGSFIFNSNNMVAEYEKAILSKNLKSAQNILISQLGPYLIENTLSSNEVNINLDEFAEVNIDKFKIQESLTSSFILLQSGFNMPSKNETEFLKLELLNSPLINEKSKIKISRKNNPVNTDYDFEFKARLDGVRVKLSDTSASQIFLDSNRLSTGMHRWSVQSYLVSKKEKRSYVNSLNYYYNQRNKYQIELEIETDQDKILGLKNSIKQLDLIIRNLKLKYEISLKQVGELATIEFEVP